MCRNMKSCTVQMERTTVRMLKIMASIRVKMISSWPGMEYFGQLNAMSMIIRTAEMIRDIVRKSLENFLACSDLLATSISAAFSDARDSSRPTCYFKM